MLKKKYIIITPFFPSDNNHVGSFVYDQARTLIELGDYDVQIIKVITIFDKERDYSFNDIDVKIFRVIDFPFFIFPGFFNWMNSIRICKFFQLNNLFLLPFYYLKIS